MRSLSRLFDNNRAWVARTNARDPEFFARLAEQQAPEFLWIGCSDSRVPANQIVGLLPGELFVHRNVANLVVHTDVNCLSVIQFAVEALRVRHIIVCGHYGCGGVQAALAQRPLGLIDNWLLHIRDVAERHAARLDGLSEAERFDAMCRINVIAQVESLCRTTIVRDAWARGQELSVHGWIYAITDGLLHDLGVTIAAEEEVEPVVARALEPV